MTGILAGVARQSPACLEDVPRPAMDPVDKSRRKIRWCTGVHQESPGYRYLSRWGRGCRHGLELVPGKALRMRPHRCSK